MNYIEKIVFDERIIVSDPSLHRREKWASFYHLIHPIQIYRNILVLNGLYGVFSSSWHGLSAGEQKLWHRMAGVRQKFCRILFGHAIKNSKLSCRVQYRFLRIFSSNTAHLYFLVAQSKNWSKLGDVLIGAKNSSGSMEAMDNAMRLPHTVLFRVQGRPILLSIRCTLPEEFFAPINTLLRDSPC